MNILNLPTILKTDTHMVEVADIMAWHEHYELGTVVTFGSYEQENNSNNDKCNTQHNT